MEFSDFDLKVLCASLDQRLTSLDRSLDSGAADERVHVAKLRARFNHLLAERSAAALDAAEE